MTKCTSLEDLKNVVIEENIDLPDIADKSG